MAEISGAVQNLSPGGGGQPFWGRNDAGVSSNTGPLFAVDPWDTFWLGARQLPGECTLIVGDIVQLEINSKKGKGLDGARLTAAGFTSGKFQISCQIATDEQWAEIQDVVDIYWRNPGKTSNLSQISLSIYHPGLAFVKVYSAVLYGVTPPQDGKIEGAKNVVFSFRWAPYVAAAAKKKVTQSSGPSAEDKRKPAAATLAGLQTPANAPPPPPESVASNMSTSGPGG